MQPNAIGLNDGKGQLSFGSQSQDDQTALRFGFVFCGGQAECVFDELRIAVGGTQLFPPVLQNLSDEGQTERGAIHCGLTFLEYGRYALHS